MADRDKIAEEAADDNTIDPYIELAVLEAVDRIDEEADEDIAAEADKAVELIDPEVAKNRKKYHQIVCRIAGGAGTIIEAVSEASGQRSHYTWGWRRLSW